MKNAVANRYANHEMTTGHIFGYRPGSVDADSVGGAILSCLPTVSAVVCFVIPGRTVLTSKCLLTLEVRVTMMYVLYVWIWMYRIYVNMCYRHMSYSLERS